MYKLSFIFDKLNEYAPIELSEKMIAQGAYDNSGVLIKTAEQVTGVLFTLDLSETAVKRAKKLGINTIVTHHPAIYKPLHCLSATDTTSSAVMLAAAQNMNVISMHLNLDIATSGIDACLAIGLGATDYKIIGYVDETHGYGREFSTRGTLMNFVKKAKATFGSKKIIYYGNKNAEIRSVASFCGAGASEALEYVLGGGKADVIVTSDIPHHAIRGIIDNGKCLVVLPHYVAEEYGFYKFYEWAKGEFGNLPTAYIADKRFK